MQTQAQQPQSQYLTWVGSNKVIVRSSEKERLIRYYVIDGLKIYNDVVLGRNIRVVEAIGVSLTDYLDMYANEDSVVIVETEHGYEYCGTVRSGKQSRIYIKHLGIDLQNIEVGKCPERSEVLKAMQWLEENGLSIDSMVMNPWRTLTPYVIAILMRLGHKIELGD